MWCSPSKIQSMIRVRGLGGAYDHIKTFGLTPFPHFCIEDLLGSTCLKYEHCNVIMHVVC